MVDELKAAFIEGYRWCCSEQDIDFEDYEEDCEACWKASETLKTRGNV